MPLGAARSQPRISGDSSSHSFQVQCNVAQTLYDAIPYGHRTHASTHPENLCAKARLFGLAPRDPRRARVLEIGCASGGNLVPMAFHLPRASFLGIDLAEAQIASGRRRVEALGLTNIELRHMALEHFTSSETFDYIICHGVYSWVDDAARRSILRLCAAHLADEGVALVSFNALPGWHLVQSVRDMMLYHTRFIDDPSEKARQARAMVQFVKTAIGDQDTPLAALVKQEADVIASVDDAYLLHDHLADINRPEYFNQFIEKARDAGLDYLADTNLAAMLPENLAPAVAAKIREIGDVVRMEQYLDFLRARRFREVLLCRGGAPLDRRIDDRRLRDLHLRFDERADFTVEHPVADTAAEAQCKRYLTIGGGQFGIHGVVTKVSLQLLAAARPAYVAYDALQERIARHLGIAVDEVARRAGDEEGLARLVFAGAIDVSAARAECVREVSRQPCASHLARMQSAWGDDITNRYHEVVEVTDVHRLLIRHLDGSLDLDGLVDVLEGYVESGQIAAPPPDPPGEHAGDGAASSLHRAALTRRCESMLEDLARQALLVG